MDSWKDPLEIARMTRSNRNEENQEELFEYLPEILDLIITVPSLLKVRIMIFCDNLIQSEEE